MAKNLAEEVYQRLHDYIINLRIKPGEKVSEVKLAEKYNVSRGPIRQVIQRLQQEGLVVVKSQVGTIIMPIYKKGLGCSPGKASILEPYAAEKAATAIEDSDLMELEQCFNALDRHDLTNDERVKLLFSTDIFLHQTIWRLSGNEEIIQILNNYPEAVKRIRHSTLELDNRLVPSRDEMMTIYQALAKRDPIEARVAMYEHIANISNSLEHVINSGRK